MLPQGEQREVGRVWLGVEMEEECAELFSCSISQPFSQLRLMS